MQTWEYCAIVGISVTSGGRLVADQQRFIHYFKDESVQVVKVNVDDQHALAKAIAGLGADGWELVACGNLGPENHVIYFKKPANTTKSAKTTKGAKEGKSAKAAG